MGFSFPGRNTLHFIVFARCASLIEYDIFALAFLTNDEMPAKFLEPIF